MHNPLGTVMWNDTYNHKSPQKPQPDKFNGRKKVDIDWPVEVCGGVVPDLSLPDKTQTTYNQTFKGEQWDTSGSMGLGKNNTFGPRQLFLDKTKFNQYSNVRYKEFESTHATGSRKVPDVKKVPRF